MKFLQGKILDHQLDQSQGHFVKVLLHVLPLGDLGCYLSVWLWGPGTFPGSFLPISTAVLIQPPPLNLKYSSHGHQISLVSQKMLNIPCKPIRSTDPL